MIAKTRKLKKYIAVIEDMGVRVLDIGKTGSNHYRISVEADGRRRFFIAACSSSDRRAVLNFRCDVRRWLHENESQR